MRNRSLNWIRIALVLIGLAGATLAVRSALRLASVSQRHDELLLVAGKLPASDEPAIRVVRLPSESLPGEYAWRWRVAIPPNCQPYTFLGEGAIAARGSRYHGRQKSITAWASPDGREEIVTLSLGRNSDGKWQVGGGDRGIPLHLLDQPAQDLLNRFPMDELVGETLRVGEAVTIPLNEAGCLLRIRSPRRADIPEGEDEEGELSTGFFLYLMSAQHREAFAQSSRRSP